MMKLYELVQVFKKIGIIHPLLVCCCFFSPFLVCFFLYIAVFNFFFDLYCVSFFFDFKFKCCLNQENRR